VGHALTQYLGSGAQASGTGGICSTMPLSHRACQPSARSTFSPPVSGPSLSVAPLLPRADSVALQSIRPSLSK